MELKRDPPSYRSIRRLRIDKKSMESSALTPDAVRSSKSTAMGHVSATTVLSRPQLVDDDRNGGESEINVDDGSGTGSGNDDMLSSTMSLSSGERVHIDVKEAETSCNETVNGCDDGSNVV